MDISAKSVLAGKSLTGRMDPGMNTNIYTEYIKSKTVCISIRNIFLYSSLVSDPCFKVNVCWIALI